ncbi:hypothetical protein ACSQ67_021898 [Phaseolus vulgaris]
MTTRSATTTPDLMNALHYDAYGGGAAGLKHVQVGVPTPKTNEVLLKLEATSINPIDWKIQKGTDVAGEIVEIGPQVKDFKVGDKVLTKLTHQYGGGLAEFAVASESITASRPPEVSAAEAAALPIAALTARDALTQIAGVKLDGTGQTRNILVTAASGGVGHYAVQLAKLGNTHVTATCGARNIEFVKGLGADEVLDYRTPEGQRSRVHLAVVVDLTPNASSLWTAALKKVTFSKKRLVPFVVTVQREGLEHLLQLVKDGKLKSVIDSKFPLSKAEDAWAKSIDGHATGKIVVEP